MNYQASAALEQIADTIKLFIVPDCGALQGGDPVMQCGLRHDHLLHCRGGIHASAKSQQASCPWKQMIIRNEDAMEY